MDFGFTTLTKHHFDNFEQCPLIKFVPGQHQIGCNSEVPFPFASCCQLSRIPASHYTLIGQNVAVQVEGELDLTTIHVEAIASFQPASISPPDSNPDIIYVCHINDQTSFQYYYQNVNITEYIAKMDKVAYPLPGNYAMIGSVV